MANSDKNVNIYLTGKSKDEIFKGATSSELYIIHQNDVLHSENRRLVSNVIELETKIEELVSDEDNNDKRNTYIKSLLKNFHEINKINQEIYDINCVIIDTIKKDNQTLYNSTINYTIMFILFLIVNPMIYVKFQQYYIYISWFINITYYTTTCIFLYLMIKNIPLVNYPVYQEKLDKLLASKKEIEKGQDYIHEFIDQL